MLMQEALTARGGVDGGAYPESRAESVFLRVP